MATYPNKPYYTSSEAVKMILQPQSVPKLNRATTISLRPLSRPAFEPLLKPSFVRAESVRRSYSMPFKSEPNVSCSAPPINNLRAASAPKRINKRYMSEIVDKAPFAPRNFSAPLISRFQRHNSSISRYSSLGDPHLQDYFARKFSLQPRSSNSSSIKGIPTAYKVSLKVGEIKNAGSTANVYLRMIGRKVRVFKQKLTAKSGLVEVEEGGLRFKFNSGFKHVFLLKGPTITHMKTIIVESDGLTKKEGLYIENIEIEEVRSKKIWFFPCNQWLSLYENDCQISRELFPQARPKRYIAIDYEICTQTGSKLGSGTDANVFVTIYGNQGTTARLHLHSSDSKAPFERNRKDRFIIHTKSVGKLKKLRIEHDNTGRAPGWFLEFVTVRNMITNEQTNFPCGQWFAKNEDDGRICRDLLPAGNGGKGNTVDYKISVFTGTKRGAGTDANVFVCLFGKFSDSGEFQLQGRGNLFENGNKDDFDYELPDLGSLTKLRIRHDNSGIGPGWFLEKVVIFDGKQNYEFPCDRWLSKTEDDSQITRDLVPMDSSRHLTPYDVTITTEDKRFAGTSAKVFLELYASKHAQNKNANSGRLWLEGGKFDRGSVDHFKLEVAGELSPLSYIVLGHDNSGMGAGWCVKDVIISCPISGIEQRFPCGRWLATDEDDGLIERQLEEDKQYRKTHGKGVSWDVTVHTSDISGAGTDANVHITIYGNKGKSDQIWLKSESDTFEKGKSDTMSIETPDLGIPTKIRIGHDDKKSGSGWHLQSVELKNRLTKDKYLFKCDRWFAKDEDDGEIVREIPAEGVRVKKPLEVILYDVQVFTGDKRGAGTDADVFCCIFGKHGDTGDRNLEKSETNRNKFERNKIDKFVLEAVDLGKLEKIKIGHNNKGIGAGWFLDKVVVKENGDHNSTWSFPCGRWLAEGEDDGQIVRELFTQKDNEMSVSDENHQNLLDTTSYKLSIRTGDIRGAGTDADVFIQLYGSKSDTGKIELRKSENNKDPFERAKTDIFTIESGDIGKIQKLHIGHNGVGMGSGWYLDEIEVSIPSRGENYRFPCNRWLDTNEADGLLDVTLTPIEKEIGEKEISYEITVKTGDEKKAGTDAAVSIQIYGVDGKTQTKVLGNKSDNFESDQTDSFKISDVDVGKIHKIRVAIDKSSWFLDWIKIRRPRINRKSSLNRKKSSSSRRYSMDSRKYSKSSRRNSKESRKPSRKISTAQSHRKSISLARKPSYGRESLNEQSESEEAETLSEEDSWTEEESPRFSRQSQRFSSDEESDEDSEGNHKRKRSSVGSSRFQRKASRKSTHSTKRPSDDSDDDDDNYETYWFVCRKWFGKDKDDGQTVRELVPTDKNGNPIDRKGLTTNKYILHVFTGNVSGAGTDANVFVSLYGKNGDTGERQLKISQNRNKFERNQEDIFELEAVDLGKIEKLKVWHDNSGFGAAWYLEKIELIDKEQKYIFPCENWLSSKEGDGLISRDLVSLSEKQLRRKSTSASLKDEFALELSAKMTSYNINVKTSDARGSGTDANVYVCLYGTKSDTGNIALKSSKTHQNKFESGQNDEFTIETADIGDLEKIFNQRGAGTDADVYVAIFGPDGRSSRQMSLCPQKKERKNHFNKGSIDKFIVQLEDVGDQLTKMRIGHDGRGMGDGWHLDKVEVTRLLGGNKGHVTHLFLCGQWLAKDEGDGSTVRDLIPQEIFAEKLKRDGSVEYKELPKLPSLKLKDYKVKVYTGDIWRAGTDANVHLCIYGSNGDTGKRQLKESETHKNKFERANTDIFNIEAADLGELEKIDIGHDDSSFASDWFLDKVEIDEPETGQTYVFHCERWIGKGKEDGELERTLFEKDFDPDTLEESRSRGSVVPKMSVASGSILAQTGTGRLLDYELTEHDNVIPYTIKVTTGSNDDDGTSAPVFINIFGGKKTLETGRIQLEIVARENTDFEPASTELFSVDAVDVGKIHEIEIGIDSSAPGDAWLLNQIEIIQPTKGRSYAFRANEWIGRGKGDGLMKRCYYAQDTQSSSLAYKPLLPYEVCLRTADQSGSGTDCDIWLQLFGTDNGSNIVEILKTDDRFERGKTDILQMDLEEIGQPLKLRIGLKSFSEGTKVDRGRWLLDGAELKNLFSDKTFIFQCQQWMDIKLKEDPSFRDLVSLTAKGEPALETTDYIMHVETSDKFGAGTDANVSCILFGEYGDSGQLELKSSETHGNKFENGNTDVFQFKNLITLGRLSKLRIWHDNTGVGAAWHLSTVVVYDVTSGQKYTFPCGKWLSISDDDKQLCRELSCQTENQNDDLSDGKTKYEITVITGDKREAGTVHHGWVVLIGDGDVAHSTEFWLENSKSNKVLRRAQTDTFLFKNRTLENIVSLRLGHFPRKDIPITEYPESERENAWFCQEIVVRDVKSGKKWYFPCKSWIQLGHTVHDAVEFQCTNDEEDEVKNEQDRQLVTYDITVVTGDERGAGTDANVFITLYGQNGDSGKRALKQKMRNLFERSQFDHFSIEVKDLGPLIKVEIEHDDSGFGAGWLLDHIEVRPNSTGEIYKFPCNMWLDKNKGDKKTRRELLTSN